MENEIKNKETTRWIIAMALIITLAVMGIFIEELKERLNILEHKTNQQNIEQQSQIDSLSLNIEAVRDEMRKGFESQQIQIDSQQEQITTQKGIQSNTIKAFVRYQKQQADTNEEFKEELKKD